MLFERVAILGVGLIGGSFALALKEARACGHVVGPARAALGRKIAQFVPAPPIAGAEKSGAEAASAALFSERRVVLTPLPENSDSAVKKVHAAWSACGARIARMNPEEHDCVLGAVSHLPHVLAYALVHE